MRTPPVRRSFPWVFPLLYLGVFAAGAYYEAAGLCGGFSGPRLAALGGALLMPFGLELLARRFWPSPAGWTAVAVLLARMLLFELVAAQDCSGFSKFLYLIVPFSAYFIDRRLSYALAVFYVGLVVSRLNAFSATWYLQGNYLSDVLILSIGLVFAVAMAAVVSVEEASRLRAERLLADLERSHAQLTAYAAQAAGLAAAEERNRLARDIHDSLGHSLAVISVQLEKALAYRERDPQGADKAVGDARRAAREALHDVRQSVGALREAGADFVLADALAGLVGGVDGEALRVNLSLAGDETIWPRPVLLALYRVAQEGLTNVHKHAAATQAALEVTFDEQGARLTLRDNGRGLQLAATGEAGGPHKGHFGWLGMRERLELVGGTLRVDSAVGQGTTLAVTIPRPARLAQGVGALEAGSR